MRLINSQLVTIIIAVYQKDSIEYLEMAINSALAQSYEPVEIIISIDGLIDSDKRCFIDNISRRWKIKVIESEINKGPAAARNRAILEAGGKYIAVMDADDISYKHRISCQIAFLESAGLDVVSSSLDVIDGTGGIIGSRIVPVGHSDIIRLAPFRCPLHNPSVFGKSEIFQKYLYDEKYQVSEDYELWIRLLSAGYLFGNCKQRLVAYRQKGDAIGKRMGFKYALADFKVKIKAIKMVPWHFKPFAIAVAFLASAIRLMPGSLFIKIYNAKDKVINKLYS